jgi:predicted RNA polymerase sigma factor
MLHVIALAKYTAVYTRSWAADSPNARVRLRAEGDRSQEDAALLREELRIKDARMARIPSQRRPYFTPTERLAILEVRAARGWSVKQTANAFLVTPATVTSWMKRMDEDGSEALVQLPTLPVHNSLRKKLSRDSLRQGYYWWSPTEPASSSGLRTVRSLANGRLTAKR